MKQNLKLRRERELRGWSQAKVAEEIGTDPVTVSRWERGLSFPYPYFREKLCTLFHKNAEELGLVQNDEASQVVLQEDEVKYGVSSALPPVSVVASTAVYDPAIPIFQLSGGLVGRETLVQQLKQRLCEGCRGGDALDSGQSTGVILIALNGLPGVGKTALATQMVRDPTVLQCFNSGVLWAGLGPRPNVLGHLSRWGALLGVNVVDVQDEKARDSWIEALRFKIGSHRILLVIDDVWDLQDALALCVGGARCAILVTTRFPQIALDFAGTGAVVVHELSEEDGVTLLQHLAPSVVASEPGIARELVCSVGGLPLALTLMGKHLRAQFHSSQPRRVRAALERLRNALERLQLSAVVAPVEQHTSLSQGTAISLQSVISASDLLLNEETRRALRALSIFPPKPNKFSEEAALAVCDQPCEVLDTLTDAGLLECVGPGWYTLHQTIADYAQVQLDNSAAYLRFVKYFMDYAEKFKNHYADLEQQLGNIVAAFQIAFICDLQNDFVPGIANFVPFLIERGMYALAERYLRYGYNAALSLGQPSDVATMLRYFGEIMQKQENYNEAEMYLQASLRLLQALKDEARMCGVLITLGEVAIKREYYVQAEDYFQEGLALATKQADSPSTQDCQELLARTNYGLARVAIAQNDVATANLRLSTSLAFYAESGHRLAPQLRDLQCSLQSSASEEASL